MIENKADFYAWLERKHFKEIKKKNQPRVEPRPNKLKIFLLEYIVGKLDFLNKENVKKIFESVFYKREKILVEEVKILEEDFIKVKIKSLFDTNKKAIIYIVLGKGDFKRFLYFYTFADSEFIEKVMNYLVKNQVYLDYFWFSANLFREYLKNKEIGKLIGATVKQNKNYLSLKWTGDLVSYVKEIIGYLGFNSKKELYNKIIEKSIFTSIDIMSDTVRYRLSKNGKLMIFGAGDIFSVIRLINYISKFYLEHLRKVEKNNIEINFNEEERIISISKGQSIVLEVKFRDPEQSFLLDNWLNKIVSLNDKYRLVGYYDKIGEETYLVKVVDYYVGQDFHMIVFKDKIEMYLQKNNCGNIFHRFVTNLYDDFEIENISYNLENNK